MAAEPKELRAIVVSGAERNLLFDVMKQMHSESRKVFAGAARSVVEAFDASRPIVPFERNDSIIDVIRKALMMAGAEEATVNRMLNELADEALVSPAGDWLKQPEVLRSALEWAALDGYKIRDPAGWRVDGGRLPEGALEKPIPKSEYEQRLRVSSIGPA